MGIKDNSIRMYTIHPTSSGWNIELMVNGEPTILPLHFMTARQAREAMSKMVISLNTIVNEVEYGSNS